MKKVGVIGLGDMGSGLAKNLIQNRFETVGFDLSQKRMTDFEAMGGNSAQDVKSVAQNAATVFLMVMTFLYGYDSFRLVKNLKPTCYTYKPRMKQKNKLKTKISTLLLQKQQPIHS